MRPVLPVALAMLTALPAAAAGHRHAAKSHAAHGASAAAGGGASTPSALATPYDYGPDALSAKGGATPTIGDGKTAKATQDDLASLIDLPNTGAARKHGKAQVLPAY